MMSAKRSLPSTRHLLRAIRPAQARPRIAPPRGWKPGQALPPKPPRWAGPAPSPRVVLTVRERRIRGSLTMIAALIFGFLLQVTVVGQLQHMVAQQQLTDTFRLQLAEGTAPVSEGTVDKVLLADGAPVALIDIPALGVREVIVEGTGSATTQSGPGHRRDTVLPGQAGVSVVMGRAAAYGAPFARIQELRPGQKFTVLTGQGTSTFSVIGVRYAGDPAPASPRADQGRLILETARGPAFVPSGIARVDAELVSETYPAGQRQTSFATLRPAERELAGDTSTVWALVFALQFFLLVELAAVWCIPRVGAQKTWIVFIPVGVLSGLVVADQVVRLLPNLL
ncbi:sortase [Cryobacterium ruanii]|nr:sortase [Cryobacterium ruanii]